MKVGIKTCIDIEKQGIFGMGLQLKFGFVHSIFKYNFLDYTFFRSSGEIQAIYPSRILRCNLQVNYINSSHILQVQNPFFVSSADNNDLV